MGMSIVHIYAIGPLEVSSIPFRTAYPRLRAG
jgi:hypothetical protein